MSETQRKSGTRKVTLTCNAPSAKSVAVAGDFNHWDPTASPMSNAKNGNWQIKLLLAPGQHEFKYVVDGQWCCEPGIDDHCCEIVSQTVENPFGTKNRILNIN
jgi:1,4-alpha-glucan branching enzyme